MSGVFISYSREDFRFVEKLEKELQQQDIDVWVDKRRIDPGERVSNKLDAAILEHDYFAVVLSPESIRSEWVQKEIGAALSIEANINRRKSDFVKIIPLMLREVQLPDSIRDKNYIDFRDENQFSENVQELAKSVQKDSKLLYELRLIVENDGGGYRARWIEPEMGESEPFSLPLPLTLAERADLQWYLETYHQFPGAGDHARAEGIEKKFEAWGKALFDSLFNESPDVYRRLKGAIEPYYS